METTNREICAGALPKKTAGICERLSTLYTKGKECLPKLLQKDMYTSFARSLLVALLNKGSRERRFLSVNPNASVPVYDILNAGPRQRFCTANVVAHNCLGLGYGTGFMNFPIMCHTFGADPMEVIGYAPTVEQIKDFESYLEYMKKFPRTRKTMKKLRKMSREKYLMHVCSWVMVNEWRRLNKPTTDLWALLARHFKAAVASPHPRYMLEFSPDPEVAPKARVSDAGTRGAPEFIIRMPNGRDLTYHKISITKDGGLKCKTDLYAKGKNEWVYTHGGSLTENVVQGLSRDVFGYGLTQLYYEDIPTLFSSHDEGIFEPLIGEAEKVNARVDYWMTQTPPFMPGLVLGNKSDIADKYMKG